MTKIIKSELDINIKNVLDSDVSNAETLINAIQNFNDNSKSQLAGVGYDSMREKAAVYVEMLETRRQVANELINAINTAYPAMKEFMGEDYPNLDTANLKEINEQLIILRGKYNNAIETYKSLLYVHDADQTAFNATYADEMQDYKSKADYYLNQIRKLEKLQEKLKNLDTTDEKNYSKFNKADDVLTSYTNKTNNLEVSNIQY